MKFLSYKISNVQPTQIGVLQNQSVYNLNALFGNISLIDVLQIENYLNKITSYIKKENPLIHNIKEISFLPVIPRPTSLKDAYAFREHVETCRKNRGAKMIAEFDKFPVFYFSNHNAMYAHGEDIELMPDHFNKLDYELELAVIIGKEGKNILSKDAEKYIAGFCILNDLSARGLQTEEMKLNLGPAKGKDFANILGPYLVTKDELETKAINTPNGKKYNLKMKCYINNELFSQGNAKDMHWTFAQIIERVSYGANIYPGDVIGSGTVGSGCLFEINGSRKRANPNYKEIWLKENDEIKMEIDGLGYINNKIIKANTNHSIIK